MSVCEVFMRKYALFVVLFLVTVSLAAKKKPEIPDPVLCKIKTVLVTGDSLAADEFREWGAKQMGLTVVDRAHADADGVDAILAVSQKLDLETGPGTAPVNDYIVHAVLELADKDGTLVWNEACRDVITRMINFVPVPSGCVGSLVKHFKKQAACAVK
jgi:hypothetical protein